MSLGFNSFDRHGDHPEIDGHEKISPPSDEKKSLLHDRVNSIAKTGRRFQNTEDSPIEHLASTTIPGTKNTLTVVCYDQPLTHEGVEGLVAQVTLQEAIGEPEIIDHGHGDVTEHYARNTTTYRFFEIPDGLHIDKATSYSPNISEMPTIGPLDTQEDWDRMWAGYNLWKEMEAANQQFEREMGVNFFSQQDIREVNTLLTFGFGIH